MKLERIVIAVDFTVDSTAAVTWVARYFAPHVPLLLVHALDIPDASTLRGEREEDVAARRETEAVGARARLDAMIEWLGCDDARSIVAVGNPTDVLLEAVRTWGGQLLVVGRHGRRPGLWNVLGSTADGLLGRSDVPVLVAGGMRDAPPSHVLVAAAHGITERVAQWARLLYDAFRPRITVFHSVSVAVPTHLLSVPGTAEGLPLGQTLFDHTRAEGDRWTGVLAGYGIPPEVIGSEVSMGEAGSEIVAAADRLGADLIVVDRPGEGGLRRALLGSVTREVIRHAAHPVLVVQHEDGHVADPHAQTLFA